MADDIPRLAGQHQPYLKAAFLGYASGSRRLVVMQSVAVSDQGAPTIEADDLEAVMRWFLGLLRGVSGDN